MKANNLTLSIGASCNNDCPYCVSKMTFFPKENPSLFIRNLPKAQRIAEIASVNSVLITSKGEPLLNTETVLMCCEYFASFPLEIQTNGVFLTKQTIGQLYKKGVNTVAISVDSYKNLLLYRYSYDICNDLGINVRITVVLSDLWDAASGYDFLADCNTMGIKQVTLRTMTVPVHRQITKESINTADWITNNNHAERYEGFLSHIKTYETKGNLIRTLPFGSSVYDMEGVAVTTIPYCIQEANNTTDIRSLIYHQDGHLYSSWDKRSSIIF